MQCILCDSPTQVLESRSWKTSVIRRRRKCLNEECNHRFTTYEGHTKPLKRGEVKTVNNTFKDVDEAMDNLIKTTRQCKLISRSILEKCNY